MSQCSEDEWRTQMNKEITREALFYPQAEVKIKTAKDDNRKQIEDIKEFIREGVDLLVVAPNEADAIAPIIEEVFDAGIPCRAGRPENTFRKNIPLMLELIIMKSANG